MSITGFHRMDNSYADGYSAGYSAGYVAGVIAKKQAADRAERIRITAAFGAIRRAVEIAHEHERQAELYRNDEWEPFRDIEELQCARAVRSAIRAAIGSPKV